MSIHEIGIRGPEIYTGDSFAYDDETGMEYQGGYLPDGTALMGVSHDAVGLVTWYSAPTMNELVEHFGIAEIYG